MIDFIAKIIDFYIVNKTATASRAATANTVTAMVPVLSRPRFNA
jgi:hypothetical protein